MAPRLSYIQTPPTVSAADGAEMSGAALNQWINDKAHKEKSRRARRAKSRLARHSRRRNRT